MAHHGIYPDINSTFATNVKYQITAPYHQHHHHHLHQLQTTSPSTTTLINNNNKSFLFDDGNTSMSSASNNNTTAPNFNETSHNSSASTTATKTTAPPAAATTTTRNPATSENTTDSGGGGTATAAGKADAGRGGGAGPGVDFMGRTGSNGAFGDGGNFQKSVSISRKTESTTGDSITYNINNINTNIVNNINNSSNISHGTDFFGNQHQLNGDTVVNINNGNNVMTAPFFVAPQQPQSQPAQQQPQQQTTKVQNLVYNNSSSNQNTYTNLDNSSGSRSTATTGQMSGGKSFTQLYDTQPQSTSGVSDYGDVFDGMPVSQILNQFENKNPMKHPAAKVPPNYYYPQATDYQGSQHTYGGLPASCSGYQQQPPKQATHQDTSQKTTYAYDPYHASIGTGSADASNASNYLSSCNRPLYARQQPTIPTNHHVYSSHDLIYQNDQRLHGHQSIYPSTLPPNVSSLAANVYHHKPINPLTTTANNVSNYPPPNYNLNVPLIRSSSSIVNPRNGDPNYYMLKPQQPTLAQQPQPAYANNPYCLQNNANLLSAPPTGAGPVLGNVQPTGPQFPKSNAEIMLDTGGHHHYFDDYQHSNSAYNKTMRTKSFNHIYNGPYYTKHQVPPNLRPPMGYHPASGYYQQNPHFHQVGDATNYMLNPYAKAGAMHGGHPGYPYGGLYKAPPHPQYPPHMAMANGRPKPLRPNYYEHPHQVSQMPSTLPTDKQPQFVDLEDEITGSKILKTRECNNYMPPQYPNYPGNFYYQPQPQKVSSHVPPVDDPSKGANLREFINSWVDEDDEVADSMPSGAVAVPVPIERTMADLPILSTYDTTDNSLQNLQKFSEESIPNNQPGVIVKHSINIPVSANLPDIVVDSEKIARADECPEAVYNEQLYVLESYEIPISEFGKYKHLSVIEKLPENVVPFSDKEFTGGVENSLKFLEDIDKNWNENDLEFDVEYEHKDQQRPPTAESSSKENQAVQETVVPAGDKAKVPAVRKYRKRKAQQAFGERSFSDTDINTGKTINPEKIHRHRKWMRTKFDRKNRVLKKGGGQERAMPLSPKPIGKSKVPPSPKKARAPAIARNLVTIRKPYETKRKLKTQTVVKSLKNLCIELFNTKSYREYFRAHLSPATSKTNSKTLLIQQFKNQLKAKQNDTAKRRQCFRKSVIIPLKDMCKEIVLKGKDLERAADQAFINDIDKINPEMSFDETYENEVPTLATNTSTEEENREFLENINRINPEANFERVKPDEIETVVEPMESEIPAEFQEPEVAEPSAENQVEESKPADEPTSEIVLDPEDTPEKVEVTITKKKEENVSEHVAPVIAPIKITIKTNKIIEPEVFEKDDESGSESEVEDVPNTSSVERKSDSEDEPTTPKLQNSPATKESSSESDSSSSSSSSSSSEDSDTEAEDLVPTSELPRKSVGPKLRHSIVPYSTNSSSDESNEATEIVTIPPKLQPAVILSKEETKKSPPRLRLQVDSNSKNWKVMAPVVDSSDSSSDESETAAEPEPIRSPGREKIILNLPKSKLLPQYSSSEDSSSESSESETSDSDMEVESQPQPDLTPYVDEPELEMEQEFVNERVDVSDEPPELEEMIPQVVVVVERDDLKIKTEEMIKRIEKNSEEPIDPEMKVATLCEVKSLKELCANMVQKMAALLTKVVPRQVVGVAKRNDVKIKTEKMVKRIVEDPEIPKDHGMTDTALREVKSLEDLCIVVLQEMKATLIKVVSSLPPTKHLAQDSFNIVEVDAEEIAQIPLPGEAVPLDEPQLGVIIPVSRVHQPLALKDMCHNFIYANKQLFEISEAFEVPKLQDLCQTVLSETNIFVDAEKICFFNDEEVFQTNESEQVFYVEDQSGSLADLFNSDDDADHLILPPPSHDDDDQTESVTKISEYISEMQREHENSMELEAINDCDSVATVVETIELSDSDVTDLASIEFQNIQYEEVVQVDDMVYQKERLVARLRHKYINRMHLTRLLRCKLLRKYLIYQRYSRFRNRLVLREQLRGFIAKYLTRMVNKCRKNKQPCDKLTEYEDDDDDNKSTTSCSSPINNEIIETNVINKFSSYDKSCCLDKTMNDENNSRRININNNTILEDSNSYTSSSCLSSRPSLSGSNSSSDDEADDRRSESGSEYDVNVTAVAAAATPGSPAPLQPTGVRSSGPRSKKKPTFDESLLSIDKYYAKNATNIKNRRRHVPSPPPPGRMRRLIIPKSKIFDARLDCKLKMKPYVKLENIETLVKSYDP